MPTSKLDHPLMHNNISRDDLDALIEYLRLDDPKLTQSSNVLAFEDEWSNWLGVKHSVFVNSGSSANLISLAVLREMADGGAMLPLGSTRERGGHKGYCLGAMIDILSGVLGGANWGPFTPVFTTDFEEPPRRVGIGLGHFFGAMRIEAFIDPDEFKRQIDDWIRTFRKTKPAPGTDGPIIPGDPEREAELIRRETGIPLVAAVVQDLREVAEISGVPFD